MKNFLYSVLVFISSFCSVLSQIDNTTINRYSIESNLLDVKVYVPGKSVSNEIGGSEYLFPDTNNRINVKTIKGNSFQLVNCNYNLNTKKIEAFVSKDKIFQYDLNQFDYLVKGTEKYKVVNSSGLNGLLMELFNGQKIALYKEISVTVQRGIFNPILPSQSTNDKYRQSYSYYVCNDGDYAKIKLGSKDVLRSVSDHEKAVKEYVKKANLKYNSEDDVIDILKYYNSL